MVPVSLWQQPVADVDTYAAMAMMVLLQGGEGESPCRKQCTAWMLVAVSTAWCLYWLIGLLRPMDSESREPGGEWKDKHVRDRVETKETMRGLHVVAWTESLIIVRKIAVVAVSR